ncbi:DUF4280 domain-containing protein [Paenibacillus farraposensis]|jgi:hypothetical protein|uniref:DUF4280 domain-containing protein n=1 Tax=Paenibacillus farraposensis TaxID=2807095 RepID=A0ABW4DC47_9BACL|nr:DUF4280 domain-containing protein [Paenibacillus farraposensis]MCC3378819.1 DUF4280 domain-containing protein [Paenibacillus farraposensis]
MSGDKSFVVHGAFAFCDQGSRPARIIVPASHGEYIHEQPQLNIHDFFPERNVRPFGVCKSLNNPAVQAEMKKVEEAVKAPKQDVGWFNSLFMKEEDIPLEQLPPPECVAMCTPKIVRPWDFGKEDVKVGPTDAMLSSCCNSCLFGGNITIIDNGQRK